MFKTAKTFLIRTLSSTHAGSGSDLGIVDLPIQRERHTSFPKIESSSLKGSIREAFENRAFDLQNEPFKLLNTFGKLVFSSSSDSPENIRTDYDLMTQLTFGYDEDSKSLTNEIKKKFEENTEYSGCIAFTDARLLLFPVRSAKGVFAWITCPYVLNRYIEDLKIAKDKFISESLSVNIDNGKCIVPGNVVLIGGSVVLEEYTFTKTDNKTIDNNLLTALGISEFADRLVVLSNDDFRDFVNLSTEVVTRTKIDNVTGTVKKGALFNEEYLPPESILYFITFSANVFSAKKDLREAFNGSDDVMKFFVNFLPQYMQIGGNATIGKGIVEINKLETEKKEGKSNG